MKILRSVLFVAIGVVSIVLATTTSFWYHGHLYDENHKTIANFGFSPQNLTEGQLLLILGGATLIVCAIPTNIKRKKEGEQ